MRDGYNLAMLEAMATGAPVVSYANPTSFITDGVDGFLSDDINSLRKTISSLMDDRELATSIGAAGKRTVEKRFGLEAFLKKWNTVFYDIARGIDL